MKINKKIIRLIFLITFLIISGVTVSASTSIEEVTPNNLSISTNNTEHIRINPDGDVGIGISDPDSKLDVSVGTNGSEVTADSGGSLTGAGFSIRSNKSGQRNVARLNLIDDYTGQRWYLINRQSDNNQFLLQNANYSDPANPRFNTPFKINIGASSNTLVLDKKGVGIGTKNPSAELHIGGQEDGPKLGINKNGYNRWMSGYFGSGVGYNGSKWVAHTDGSHNGGILLAGDPFGNMRFITVNNTGDYDRVLNDSEISSKEKMRITSAGDVGIGTSNPNRKLHVNNGGLLLTNSSSGEGGQITLRDYSSNTFWNVDSGPNENFRIIRKHSGGAYDAISINDDTSDLTINSVLNVGIGTNNPSNKLDINGKIRMQDQTQSSDTDDTVATKGYVDNNVFSGYERVSNTCSGSKSCSVSCPSGKRIVGGGCDANGGGRVLETYPSSSDTWQCVHTSDNNVAYAICVN